MPLKPNDYVNPFANGDELDLVRTFEQKTAELHAIESGDESVRALSDTDRRALRAKLQDELNDLRAELRRRNKGAN